MKDLKIKVFEQPLENKDNKYGVMLSIGNQSFKLDYYGDREEAEWMKGILNSAISSLLSQQRKEVWEEIGDLYNINRDGSDGYFLIDPEIKKGDKFNFGKDINNRDIIKTVFDIYNDIIIFDYCGLQLMKKSDVIKLAKFKN